MLNFSCIKIYFKITNDNRFGFKLCLTKNIYLHYSEVSSDDGSKSKTLNLRSYHTEVIPILKNICDLEDKRKSLKRHRRFLYIHRLHYFNRSV